MPHARILQGVRSLHISSFVLMNAETHKGPEACRSIASTRRLQAFRAAGSGEQVRASPASLQRAKALLQEAIIEHEPALAELPTGACWPLLPLVGSMPRLSVGDTHIFKPSLTACVFVPLDTQVCQ